MTLARDGKVVPWLLIIVDCRKIQLYRSIIKNKESSSDAAAIKLLMHCNKLERLQLFQPLLS
jgi:hypothetical protein